MERSSAAHGAGQVDEAASDTSSALSTPPPHALSRDSPAHPHPHPSNSHGGVDAVPAASSTLAKNNSAATSTSTPNAEPKVKKQRKPRQPKDPNAPPEEKKEKKPRKPREPKDPNAPPKPPKDPNEPPKPRKRVKVKHEEEVKVAPAPSHQQKITDLVGPPQAAAHHVQTQISPQPHSQTHSPTATYSHPPPPIQQHVHVLPSNAGPPTPRPASSGQIFDPIRGAASQNASQNSMPPVSPQARVVNRASASPSITSLIDPPLAPHPSAASTMQQHARLAPSTSITSAPVSPMPVLTRPSQPAQFAGPSPSLPSQRPPMGSAATPMEVDSDKDATSRQLVPQKKFDPGSAGPSSNAPTPPTKATRAPQAPPPLPTGSGLLSGTAFGGIDAATNGDGEKKGANIWLTFDLKGKNNVTINFAREVEQKYGFAALHPRIAARNEKRRQMAAAAAALEKTAGAGSGSADDMSLDLSEPEKDSEGGDQGDDVSLTAAGLPRQRKRKVEDYDRNDDFIDDTEMAWEQQALMAKDGFFVYSGPLVTEGEKQVVERYGSHFIFSLSTNHFANNDDRADGTVRRGRGRGRGGATRGETSGRGSRGGGRGSRGGTTVRKPRVTKADRAMMEQEKLERERVAATLAVKPVQFAGPVS